MRRENFGSTANFCTHNQDALDAASLKKYAEQLGLNVHQFEIDSNSEKYAAEVRKDMADGVAYGVTRNTDDFCERSDGQTPYQLMIFATLFNMHLKQHRPCRVADRS